MMALAESKFIANNANQLIHGTANKTKYNVYNNVTASQNSMY